MTMRKVVTNIASDPSTDFLSLVRKYECGEEIFSPTIAAAASLMASTSIEMEIICGMDSQNARTRIKNDSG